MHGTSTPQVQLDVAQVSITPGKSPPRTASDAASTAAAAADDHAHRDSTAEAKELAQRLAASESDLHQVNTQCLELADHCQRLAALAQQLRHDKALLETKMTAARAVAGEVGSNATRVRSMARTSSSPFPSML